MIARTDKYDPVANSFTQLGDLNLARSYILATSVDGIIYAFGGDTSDGTTLVAQTMAEKMDPAVGTWDDAGVADLPVAGDEGQAFGFDSGTPYALCESNCACNHGTMVRLLHLKWCFMMLPLTPTIWISPT